VFLSQNVRPNSGLIPANADAKPGGLELWMAAKTQHTILLRLVSGAIEKGTQGSWLKPQVII